MAVGAVVLVAAAGLGALQFADGFGPSDHSAGSTTPVRSPVAAPTPEPNPECQGPFSPSTEQDAVREGLLEPGTYVCYALGRGIMNVQLTVPAGWEWHGSYLTKAGLASTEEARISFFEGDVQVYTDPCLWSGSEPHPQTGHAVADLVAALAAQPMRSATTPIDRNANLPNGEIPGRWAGMAVELTVPDDIDFADCDGGQFRSWGPDPNVRAHQGPGQRDLVWVVDTQGNGVNLAGERLVIDASSMPTTPADTLAEIEAILESIATGHWG
jgi:hypothetical protein